MFYAYSILTEVVNINSTTNNNIVDAYLFPISLLFLLLWMVCIHSRTIKQDTEKADRQLRHFEKFGTITVKKCKLNVDLFLIWLAMCCINVNNVVMAVSSSQSINMGVWIIVVLIAMGICTIVIKISAPNWEPNSTQQPILLTAVFIAYMLLSGFGAFQAITTSDDDIIFYCISLTIGTCLCLISVHSFKQASNVFIYIFVAILVVLFAIETVFRLTWINSTAGDEATFGEIVWIRTLMRPILFIIAFATIQKSDDDADDADNNFNYAKRIFIVIVLFLYGMFCAEFDGLSVSGFTIDNTIDAVLQLLINNIVVVIVGWRLVSRKNNDGFESYFVYIIATTVMAIVTYSVVGLIVGDNAQIIMIAVFGVFLFNMVVCLPLLFMDVVANEWIVDFIFIQSLFVHRYIGYGLIPIILIFMIFIRNKAKRK